LLAESSACFLSKHAKTDQVTGYAFVAHDMPRDCVELNDIAVARQYRHQGHGRAIIKHLMTIERDIRLCADAKRKKLIHFYYRLGFQKEAVYENYYGIGHDALRLIWRAM
jgi:ribosomal protein S18 acetylase RimI-like enzyme